MQTGNSIWYALNSAAEASVVEEALRIFREKQPGQPAEPAAQRMTKAEKLALIDREWTLDALRDIKPWILDNETVLAAMDLCAAAPETWVTFQDACKAAKLSPSQGRGQMQALTKKARNHMAKATNPVLPEQNPPGVLGLGYWMSRTVCGRWKQVRSEP